MAVAYCLGMTHDPNAEDNINSVKDLLTHYRYQTKFERMATSFAIFAIVAATLSTIVLSTGRLLYFTMHHVVTLIPKTTGVACHYIVTVKELIKVKGRHKIVTCMGV